MKKGWFEESRRHRLARLGIKTGRKSSSKKELNVLEGNPMFFPKPKKEKLDYTPTYNPSDMGAVATDVVVGTGAEVKKHAPLIAGAIVYKKVKKSLKKGRRKKKLNYPRETKKKYPVVTKELTKLSKKHNLKKPKLRYGKNKRLATFYPNKYIKLSTRLQKESKSKKKDVAQHEFKHYTDTKKTNIRDVELLEKRAVKFEQDTK